LWVIEEYSFGLVIWLVLSLEKIQLSSSAKCIKNDEKINNNSAFWRLPSLYNSKNLEGLFVIRFMSKIFIAL